MTTRRLMAAVAVVALVQTLVIMHVRRTRYLRLAAYHQREGARLHAMLDREGHPVGLWARYERAGHVVIVRQAEVEFRAQMKRKYDDAAAHPWLPVPPDPPLPK